jgi:hypothetical protein
MVEDPVVLMRVVDPVVLMRIITERRAGVGAIRNN